jgi:Carboxypeptidase regulatory-like domain
MSELSQSGRHPDADQLSAFIEHALPEHEYQLALAHLADCPECRTIVSLSLPSVDESPVLQARAARRSLFSGWKFSGWNLAWPAGAAAAFAGLAIFFVVHIHNTATARGSGGTAAQMAESNAPAPPAAAERSPISTPMAPPEPESEQLPRNAHTANGTQSKDAHSLQGRNGLSQLRPVPSNGSAGTGAAQTQGPLAQTADQLQKPSPASNMFTASRPASEAPAPSAIVGGIGQTLEVRNGATPPAVLSPIIQHPLPSHLPALSMVSSAQRILAIDTRNTLFFSDDAGNHWKTIPSPWQGRAVKVELASSAIPSGQSSVTSKLHPASSFGVVGGLLRSSARATSSKLTGTVKDTSGAVIPGASVVVSNSTTMAGGPVKTDSAGRYVVNDLSPGSYQVEVQAPGFEKQQIAVTLTASQQNLADFTLRVGQLAQTVSVGAPASASSPVALKKTAQPPPAREPLTRFEITTDTGERWTSSDGQTWMHR